MSRVTFGRVLRQELLNDLLAALLQSKTAPPASAPTIDVQPLLTRFGCNAGACHGKSRGQNGFALSLLGFDSDFDYSALTRGVEIDCQTSAESWVADSGLAIRQCGQRRRAGGHFP